jgi:hypothetical protein
MANDKKGKHSDFAERMREWEEKNPDEVARMKRQEAFMEAIRPFSRLYSKPCVSSNPEGTIPLAGTHIGILSTGQK